MVLVTFIADWVCRDGGGGGSNLDDSRARVDAGERYFFLSSIKLFLRDGTIYTE